MISTAGQPLGRTEQRGHMHIVPAGMHHWTLIAIGVGCPGGAGVIQSGGLLHG